MQPGFTYHIYSLSNWEFIIQYKYWTQTNLLPKKHWYLLNSGPLIKLPISKIFKNNFSYHSNPDTRLFMLNQVCYALKSTKTVWPLLVARIMTNSCGVMWSITRLELVLLYHHSAACILQKAELSHSHQFTQLSIYHHKQCSWHVNAC